MIYTLETGYYNYQKPLSIFDDEPEIIELEVLSIVRQYAMCKKKGCFPFVNTVEDMIKFLNRCDGAKL